MANLYLDIETVSGARIVPEKLINSLMDSVKPDARSKDTETSIANKRMKLVSEFALSPMTAQIILIGVLPDAELDPEQRYVVFTSTDEKTVLQQFALYIKALPAYTAYVTFNGKSFDLPHIMMKMMRYEISPSIGFIQAMRESPYDLSLSIDMRSILTNFDPMGRGKLKQWAMFFGYEVKEDMMDGSDIQQLWDDKDFSAIIEKNHEDLLMLRHIHRKYKHAD
jgi:uncharacterized protein YprB with RNaseH-like and TPR domain